MDLLAINENYLNNYNKLSNLNNDLIMNKLNNITDITAFMGGASIEYLNDIAILRINGQLLNKQNLASLFLGGSVSYPQIIEAIKSIDIDKASKLIIHIDSPGGMVQGIETIIDCINTLNIPKYAFIDNMACSNAYLIASLCNKLYALPSALIGSIGTIIVYENISKQLDQNGVNIEYFRGGRYKQKPNSIETLTDDDKQYLQDMVNQSYIDFYELVAKNRNLDTNNLSSWADGRVFEAKEGIELGLVDKLVLSIDDIISEISNDDKIMEYNIHMDNNIINGLQAQNDELNAKLTIALASNDELKRTLEALTEKLSVVEKEPLLAKLEPYERESLKDLPIANLQALIEARLNNRISEPLASAKTVNIRGMVGYLPSSDESLELKKTNTVADMILGNSSKK